MSDPGGPSAADAAAVDAKELTSLSQDRPLLLVCLRHLGCAFSREALADLQARREEIEACGVRLVLVHLETAPAAGPLLRRYHLDDVLTISDPAARVYDACGLARGGVRELVAPRVLWRWLTAALLRRHGAGWTGADVCRMPGVFLIDRGRIVRAFRHATSADRPDYVALCSR